MERSARRGFLTPLRIVPYQPIFDTCSRSASPYINRFLSADTIVPGYANPQNLNRYSYVTNNPLRYTDPTGHMQYEDPYTSSNGICKSGDTSCNWVGKDKDKPYGGNDKPIPAPNPGIILPVSNSQTSNLMVPTRPPSPCAITDCILSAISILASGVITAVPEVPQVSGPAFVVDLVVTFVAYRRTNQDYAQGKISQERQWILNGTGIIGVLPIPYVGFGLSIINGMATFSGYPP